MNTQRSTRVRTSVLVSLLVAGATLFAAGTAARAEVAQSSASQSIQVVYAHQGPGTGSVKTPPFHDAAYEAYMSQQSQAVADMYFHSTNGQQAVWSSDQFAGPGPWSSKAPGVH